MIGEERHAPYERPPLSKSAIVSEAPPELPVIADARQLGDLGVDVVAGVAATRIDARMRTVHLADGRALRYDKLVLATGARPRRLTLPGAELGLLLRTYEDSLALRERFHPGARIAIVGGGFIGLELAASARALGCAVQVVEAAPRVLQRATPPEISAILAERHAREGVEILTAVGVSGFACEGAHEIVMLSDGRRLEADAIVVGVGAAPEVSLAAAAGLGSTTASQSTDACAPAIPTFSRSAIARAFRIRCSAAGECGWRPGATPSIKARSSLAPYSAPMRNMRPCRGSGPISTTSACRSPGCPMPASRQ